MLDMLNIHKVRSDAAGDVFDRSNPTQSALRTVLGSYSELELAEIEQDLAYYACFGTVTERIEALLSEAEEDVAHVA
ncbi:MAG: hypothetical protein AAGK37_15650 [Pseudomonadota bacterium]